MLPSDVSLCFAGLMDRMKHLKVRWRGVIYDRPLGEGGFGYDPVFYLPERRVTVAQITTGREEPT